MFERFIARRYLLSKKKVQFITIITAISIVGVTVGVAALITVLSVFNGFSQFQLEILTGFDPHLRVESKGGNKLDNYESLISKIKNEKGIKGLSPFTINKGVLSSRKNSVVVFLKGVDDKKINEVSGVAEKTRLGKFEFKDNEDFGGVILGGNLAGRLDVNIGDTLTALSPAGMEKALTQIVQPKTVKFIIRGIYDSNNREYDKLYAFISIKKSQQLFDLGNSVSGIEARLDDINDSESLKQKLSSILGNEISVNTWYDLHAELYSVMKIERWAAFVILSLIIAVASFSIVGSLTMTVIEKKRDIGVLRAMGTTNKSIIKIFMFEGILIGIYGTVTGIFLGLTVCLLQIKYKLFPLDPIVYPIDSLPIDLRYSDFIYVSLCSMLLCFLASLYPALRASKLEPIDAIRWE